MSSYPIKRPSLLNRFKSILECFINQDIKSIDFKNKNEPYLYSHNYSDLNNHLNLSFKKKNKALTYSDDYEDDEDDYDESNTSDYESSEIELFNSNQLIKKNDKLNVNLDTKLIDNQIKNNNIKSNIFQIQNQTNKLLPNLSIKFNNWSLDRKQKYLDQLIEIAFEYIELKDYNRCEIILFELLDIIFNHSKLNKLKKSIDILNLLDFIYLEQNRFIELIEVNKLIINLSFNFNHEKNEQSLKSLNRIIYAYKKVNLDHKANEFIEQFNNKFK